MKRLRALPAAIVHEVWFGLHRKHFVKATEKRRPRVLVDVSIIVRHDARTGIQRVVRAIWSELSRRQHPNFDFVPVYASSRHSDAIAVP